ncbi:10572_t:CDS:10 [Entrophospora sp. SA101]|nr:10572_t:CDS:10 [Entrophospora sp. SA101]
MQTIFILIKLLILFSVSSWLILFSITPSFTGRQKQQKQEKTFHENNNNNNSNITTNKDICSISSRSNDCGYFGITEFECVSRNCCWRPTNEENANWCFYKDASHYTCSVDKFDRAPCDSKYLKVIVEHQTKDRLRVKIFDPYDARFEIPDNIVPIPDIELNSEQNQDINYNFTFTKDPFTFSIYRINNNGDAEKIIDTNVKNTNTLVFEDQFMEMSFELPDDPFIYGLGEIVYALRRNPNGTLQTIWTRDAPTPIDQNVYGAHPFYLEMRDGKAHGVFLRNSNGMDVKILPGNPAKLTWRVIGGVFDFVVFLGPSPMDVIAQYTDVIGRSELPPYWSLGYHQSRWGYNNLSVLSDVVSRFRKENIPLETIWTDLDYMEGRKIFTWDKHNYPKDQVKKFIDELHRNEQHYVVIVDPGLKIEDGYEPYDDGVKRNVFIKNSDLDNVVGRVWPGLTVFPDWFNNETEIYWGDMIEKWLDANWCNGECGKEDGDDVVLNKPLYRINNGGSKLQLNTLTLPMNAIHVNGFTEYNVHNLFGHMEAITTHKVLAERINKGKRPFIISRSTFPGSGKYTGHWTGDNKAQWEHLYLSIPGILNFQLFGVPMVGADICGFDGPTNEELCLRWMQLGQEPYIWSSVKKTSRKYLSIRYSLLPYIYTLFYENNKHGPGLLISPVLQPNTTTVENAFIPDGLWYDFYTKKLSYNTTNHNGEKGDGEFVNIESPLDHLSLLVRGGNILPLQYPGLTTKSSRKSNFYLIIALDESGYSTGNLYLDDGESLTVEQNYSYINYKVLDHANLISNSKFYGYKLSSNQVIDKLVIMNTL